MQRQRPSVAAPELVPGNSLSQQKVQQEVQASHGTNLALQKYPVLFSLMPVKGLLLNAGRWFLQPEVFPRARTGGNSASAPLPNPFQICVWDVSFAPSLLEPLALPQQMQPWINFCAALITELLIANSDSNVFIAVNPLFIHLR